MSVFCAVPVVCDHKACDRCTDEHLFSVTLLVSFTLNKISPKHAFESFVLFLTNSENWSYTNTEVIRLVFNSAS